MDLRTQVFIVNNDTIPIHLKYLFAGTGATHGQRKEIWMDWHSGLLSDIKRVREGDLVIFYIEATKEVKGGFYGIFKIADNDNLVFHTPGQKGFQPDLPKYKLIYRTLLEPYNVYSKGVPEWEALDKLPVYATQILWSLIYRKLKGKRGCTPLLPWEAKRLIGMIKDKNSGISIADGRSKGGFEWNNRTSTIKKVSYREKYPFAQEYSFIPREAIFYIKTHRKSYEKYLKTKYNFEVSPQHLRKNKSYESYFQLYFTENIGFDSNLNPIVGNNITWFGNEVGCGVGMQKIDILTINQYSSGKEYRIVELKDEPINPRIVEQMEYYVNWASQDFGKHLDGAFPKNIQPVVVAPQIEKKHKINGERRKKWGEILRAFKKYNDKRISLPIRYFEFVVNREQSISFKEECY